jgi:5-(carboxyamino)imidazole ribonucleotide synthase
VPEHSPLPPGTMIGILGGGQLGRMLSLAASRLGMRTHIYCPDPDSPAFEVTPHKTIAAYDDEAALAAFADAVDVITYEFENVPAATAEFLAARKPLRPGANALAISQDRLGEKAFLASKNIPVAPYRAVESLADLEAAVEAIGLPAVLKTTRLGYDGKGQRVLRIAADVAAAYEALSPKPLVLEAFVPFEQEISVVVARSLNGEVKSFDPAENVHRDHILFTSTVPANISPGLEKHAAMLAKVIVVALDYVGILGVEFFVVPGERPTLLVNEIAPRVHNSGHWTEAVCLTDQFEQHIRAVLGWPLGDPTRMADVVMENLIGDEVLAIPGALTGATQPHLYGKTEVRPGRKMAHVNRIVTKD